MGVPLSSDSLISLTLKAQVHSVEQIGHFTGNLSKRSVIGCPSFH